MICAAAAPGAFRSEGGELTFAASWTNGSNVQEADDYSAANARLLGVGFVDHPTGLACLVINT